MDWSVFTEQDALHQERFLNDWLQVVVTLSHTKDALSPALTKRVAAEVKARREIELGAIRDLKIDAWHLVFPAVFHSFRAPAQIGPACPPLSASTVIAHVRRPKWVCLNILPNCCAITSGQWLKSIRSREDALALHHCKLAIQAICDGERKFDFSGLRYRAAI